MTELPHVFRMRRQGLEPRTGLFCVPGQGRYGRLGQSDSGLGECGEAAQ
jgi:hypothetical protein